MAKPTLALALCRVSSIEQLENNSLNRQRDAVINAANNLGVIIPEDGWWSGSVSSKRGTNVGRKDLEEILERCKKNKQIKYVIVDEPDRFMRSIDEAAYFEVTFNMLGVRVWYASEPELNKGDLAAKLLKFTKYLSAEGSNEERQNKSIAGQNKALLEGRYPFSPKPGYKRGYERGIQEPHEVRGPILKEILLSVATHQVTPTQALINLNQTEFVRGKALYKMDKFRKILTDPFYAGIVEIDRQVKVRNENGLHEPLISLEQHYELVRIMENKKKTQTGPRKNGNPDFPLSNIVNCETCKEKTNGRLVGFNHGNGKSKTLVYQKYRCRSCGAYLKKDELHKQIEKLMGKFQINDKASQQLITALDKVWNQRQGAKEQEIRRLNHKTQSIRTTIQEQVEAITDPSNASIKEDILLAIARKKDEIALLQEKIDSLQEVEEINKKQFLTFAFKFIENMGGAFFNVSRENRMRCKELLFPAGFWIDQDKKVYTPQISPLITLATKKKDAEASIDSHLVRVKRL